MTVTAYPINRKQEKAIKAFFEALEIPFKITKDESSYNPEFVEQILQGSQDIKDGKGIKINVDDLWK